MPDSQHRANGAPTQPTVTSKAAREQTPRLVYDIQHARLTAHGVLDFAFAEHLTEVLHAALAEHPPSLVLDLTNVWLLDASIVRALIAFQAHTTATDSAFQIIGADGVVRRVLEITGVLPAPADQLSRPTPPPLDR
jgi:anti-anti-sigma factor